MTLIQSLILGLVQGLSEFLPISSSGHLAVLQHFFGISGDQVMTYTVMLHFGTLLSIFVAYWKDIAGLLKELAAVFVDLFTGKGLNWNKNETRRLGFLIIAATIPTAMAGLLLNDFFERLYSSMLFIGLALIVTGTGLFLAERMGDGKKGVRQTSLWDAFLIGCFQAVAICPGISRSGATMTGGLTRGFNRPHAVRFAFLISIPTVLGAFLMELPEAIHQVSDTTSSMSMGTMILGILVAAVSGYAAIKVMIRAVTNRKLIWFSFYTWIVGALLVISSFF